jgi:predicted cytidylate kinase
MIITISGVPGAGKTTVAKQVAEKLNFNFYSGGDIRGKYAQELGITIDELNERSKQEPEWHTKVDNFQTELAEKENDFVMESWMGWFFIKKAFKVFLKADSKVAAERIFNEVHSSSETRQDEKKYDSVEDAESTLAKRVQVQKESMLELYGDGADFLDESNYDLVIDTTNKSPDEVVDEILAAVKSNA